MRHAWSFGERGRERRNVAAADRRSRGARLAETRTREQLVTVSGMDRLGPVKRLRALSHAGPLRPISMTVIQMPLR